MVTTHLQRGGKALIMTDRLELLKQANGAFTKFNLSPELIVAGKEPDLTLPLHCAMIETLYRRAERYKNYLASRTLIILDEAHKSAFDKIFPYISEQCIVVGATATPFRKGNMKALDIFYQDIVQQVDTPDLIQLGFLSKARSYGIEVDLSGIKKRGGEYDSEQMGAMYSERKVYSGVIENYQRICPGQKALLFASNIASSKEVTMEMRAAGLPARHLDSEMSDNDREEVLAWFAMTPNGILNNCSILTTGYDLADIKVIIMYRATTSMPLFLQCCGRGSRIIPGVKNTFTILDFGNNIMNEKGKVNHDFWEAPRTWSLAKVQKKKKGVSAVKHCKQCNAILPASVRVCEYCGYVFPVKLKSEEEREIARLTLLSKPERLREAKSKSVKEKADMAKAKLIHPFWVLHGLTDRDEADKFCKLMGYKPQFAYMNKDKFEVFKEKKDEFSSMGRSALEAYVAGMDGVRVDATDSVNDIRKKIRKKRSAIRKISG